MVNYKLTPAGKKALAAVAVIISFFTGAAVNPTVLDGGEKIAAVEGPNGQLNLTINTARGVANCVLRVPDISPYDHCEINGANVYLGELLIDPSMQEETQ